MRPSLAVLAALVLALPAAAQPEGVPAMGGDLDRFLVRQHAAGRLPGTSLQYRPLAAYEAAALLDTLAARDSAGAVRLSRSDRALLASFRGTADAPGAGLGRRVWGGLYREGRHLLSTEGDGYRLVFEPLAYLAAGRARRTERNGRSPSAAVWQNTRGVRAAGHLGAHLFFEARVEENQRREPRELFDPLPDTAPRLGNVQQSAPYVLDYYRTTGLVGLRTRFVEVRAGRDRNAWGPGLTSLELSNYAAAYDHLQLRTRVGPVEYANLYAAFGNVTQPTSAPNEPYPRRFGAFHRLTVRLPYGVDLSAFEGVVFTDTSEGRRRRGFDPSYLNPVVLLRSAEQDRNSPDNALVGVGAAWRARRGLRLHGQFLLDEFVSDVFGSDDWKNKWGYTVGAVVGDPLVPGLVARAEYSRIRPYVYGHLTAASSYLHFESVLGHPAGANADDLALALDYEPHPRWTAGVNVARTRRGRSGTAFVGDDPRRSYLERGSDTAPLLGGIRQTLWLAEGNVAYAVLPDLRLGLALRAESLDDAETGLDRYVAPAVTLRWGVPFESARY